MQRIEKAFSQAQAAGRACFVGYVCAGDPDRATSGAVCRALIESGVDVLELGLPFSDPLADGLTNQLAAQRALSAGITPADVFDLVREIRSYSEVPVVLYLYFNMVMAPGVEAFLQEAKEAGVDGLLALDLPPDEHEPYWDLCRKMDLATVCIIAPTTPESRIARITQAATGFIYYVSREGVTGERKELAANLGEAVERIRKHTELPVAVGFGVSTPEHVQQVGSVADGVVVGSALVNCIARHADAPEQALSALREKMAYLTSGKTDS